MAMQSGEKVEMDNAALVKQCCRILREELALPCHEYIAEFASYIVGVTTHRSLSELIIAMIQATALPSALSQALMRCQLLVFEQKMPMMISASPDKQLQLLKELLEHFNYINASIVQEGEKLWAEQVDALEHDLRREHQHRILDVSMQLWKYQQKIKLLNYYKGLPVQVMVDIDCIDAVEPAVIHVRSSPSLGRVLAMQGNAFVLAPDSEDKVLIHLQVQHEQHDKVSFVVKALSSIKKRKHFRLEPIEPVAIQLYRNKKVIGRGKVLDLSLKHMDIRIPAVQGVMFEVNEIVDICFPIQKKELKGCAWVRHIRQTEQEFILCLELMPQAHLQHHLQQEVAYLQRKIIQEIKEKFTIVQ